MIIGEKLRPVWIDVITIIKRSSVPEDPIHAKNTLYWLLKLSPKKPDPILKLAAFAHDIERAISEKRVKKDNFPDFETFKVAHAVNSAKILSCIMKKHNICKEAIKEIEFLVANHENGGSEKADLIKDADSLSFFDTNLIIYAQRNSLDDVINRCIWGFKRISFGRRKFLYEIINNKKDIFPILKEIPFLLKSQK